MTQYETPVLSEIIGAFDLSTSGSETVKLTGTGLGPQGAEFASEIKVAYKNPMNQLYTPSSCVISKPHTEIQCTTVPGIGYELLWTAEIGAIGSNTIGNGTSSYDIPIITSIRPLNPNKVKLNSLNTVGRELLIISGENMGPLGSTVVAKYGPPTEPLRYSINCNVHTAHTSVLCVTAAGIGHSHIWQLTIGGQTSVDSVQTTSYRTPYLTRVYGPGATKASTVGGTEIYIAGSGFGPASRLPSVPCDVRSSAVVQTTGGSKVLTSVDTLYSLRVFYGPETGLDPISVTGSNHPREMRGQCCSVLSDVLIGCQLSAGTGYNHSWVIADGDQMSNVIHAATSYAAPVVIFYTGPGSENANTLGGEAVFVQGQNLGPAGGFFVDSVTYGPVTGTEFTLDESLCSVTTEHVLLECQTVPGAGRELQWVVTIDRQRSIFPTTYYAPPEITSFSGDYVDDAQTWGGQWIFIHGQNFATTEFLERVTYGPFGQLYEATNCTVVEASIEIRCLTAPGIGKRLRWVVRVKGQESEPSIAMTSYATPNIESITPDHGPTTGSTTIVLLGTNFGMLDSLSQHWVIFGTAGSQWSEQLSVRVERFSDTLMETASFTLPMKYGTGHQILIRSDPAAGDIVYSNAITFNYNVPVIKRLNTEDGSQPGELLLTVKGADFCQSSECGKLLLEGEEIPVLTWDHNKVTAYVSVTEGLINIGVDREFFNVTRVSNGKNFSHQSPKLSEFSTAMLSSTSFKTNGNQNLTLRGKYFGYLADVRVEIGGKEATKVANSMGCFGLIDDMTQTQCDNTQISEFQVMTPEGDGINNELIIYRGEQESVIYYFNYTAPSFTGPGDESSPNNGYVYPARDVTVQDRIFYTETVQDQIPYTENSTAKSSSRRRARSLSKKSTEDDGLKALPTPGLDVFMDGNNLGINGTVTYLGQVCRIINHDHERIDFQLPPGVGLGGRIELNVATQVAYSKKIGYEKPAITKVSPQPLSTAGYQKITIEGINFGQPASCANGQLLTDSTGTPASCANGQLLTDSTGCKLVAFMALAPASCTNGQLLANSSLCKTVTFTPSVPASCTNGQLLANLTACKTVSFMAADPATSTPASCDNGGMLNTNLDGCEATTFVTATPATCDNGGVTNATMDGCEIAVFAAAVFASCSNGGTLKAGSSSCEVPLFTPSARPTINFECDKSQEKDCQPKGQDLVCLRLHNTHGEIVCRVPQGDGFDLRTVVRVGSQTNDVTQCYPESDDNFCAGGTKENVRGASVFSYDIPSIARLDPPQGPTEGIDRLVINGKNFAQTAELSELRITIGSYVLPSTSKWILEHNDAFLAVRVPAGLSLPEGHKVTVSVHGKTNLEDVRYFYMPPVMHNITFLDIAGKYLIPPSGCAKYGIDLLETGWRMCSQAAEFVIKGINFGEPCIKGTESCTLEIWARDELSDDPVPFTVLENTHHMIRGQLSAGVGNTTIWVIAGTSAEFTGRESVNRLSFKYDAPVIQKTAWGNDLLSSDVIDRFDSQGSEVTGKRLFLFGDNFGTTETAVNISVNNQPCADAIWHKAEPDTIPAGYPYLSCEPKMTRVGSKQLSVSVATRSIVVNRLESGKPLLAKCFPGHYGLDDEYCVACWSYYESGTHKYAANCTGSYMKNAFGGLQGSEEPITQAGFYLMPPKECELGSCTPEFDVGLERIPDETCDFVVEDNGELVLNSECSAATMVPGTFCHPYRLNVSIPVIIEGSDEELQYNAQSKRSICPYVMPCEPIESCGPNNTCTDGYVSYYESYMEDKSCSQLHYKLPDGRCFAPRCGQCNPGSHFRLDGVCERCPVNPWLLPVMMASAAILSGVAMYVFSKMKVDMTAINIGVDYFQVLSIFRKSKVKWPEEISELLKQMQWFNFDIDMAGPECAFRSVFTFEFKWYVKVLLPFVAILIACAAIFVVTVLSGICSCGKKKKKKKKKEESAPIWSTMGATFLTIVVFLCKIPFCYCCCCCVPSFSVLQCLNLYVCMYTHSSHLNVFCFLSYY